MKINKIGFEFEILVKEKDYEYVYQSLYKTSRCIRIGSDPTVRGGKGWRDLELKTDPMSETRALDLFNRILALLIIFNGAGLIKTNDYCGLHVNISTGRNLYSYIQVIEAYDDVKELTKWNRLKNPACAPLEWKEEKHKFDDAYEYAAEMLGKKHKSVALRNKDDRNGIRLENRIIGGKDYILRDHDLEDTIRDFLHIIKSGPDVWNG